MGLSWLVAGTVAVMVAIAVGYDYLSPWIGYVFAAIGCVIVARFAVRMARKRAL
jgi:hypothetical protein